MSIIYVFIFDNIGFANPTLTPII